MGAFQMLLAFALILQSFPIALLNGKSADCNKRQVDTERSLQALTRFISTESSAAFTTPATATLHPLGSKPTASQFTFPKPSNHQNQMNTITTKQEFAIIREWTRLLISLKPSIADDYRCTDDPDDKSPGMLVTFGLTCCDDGSFSWSYQTGDNSYSGGAYSHRAWGLAYLNRRSNCRELAEQAFSEALDATFA